MAPCTSGPRLLRAAAVLLVTAAAVRSGPLPSQVAHRGAMVPMWRRMYRLRYGVEMVQVVVGKPAEKVWAKCTKGLPNINSDIIAEKYADWMTGTLCAMRLFTNDDGTLDTVTMFEKALETDFKEVYTDDELPKLQVLCGAGADGSRKVTPSEFIECWIIKGIFIFL